MRGSGCSGGAFDLFDLPTTYDGYDAVETVAAQTWVKGGKVGMVGISFSGITQLFIAGTQPPHLAAIAPMSVTDDIYPAPATRAGSSTRASRSRWITGADGATPEPAPGGGQPWARDARRSRATSTASPTSSCACRPRTRSQLQKENPFRTPSLFDERAPGAVAEARQGADLPRRPVPGRADRRALRRSRSKYLKETSTSGSSLQNGVHADSLGPATITRWVEFLNLYVADEIPSVPPAVSASSGAALQVPRRRPARRRSSSRASPAYRASAAAKADFEQDPRVRLLMDNGAGPQGARLDRRARGRSTTPPGRPKPARATPSTSARAARSAPSRPRRRSAGYTPTRRRGRRQTLPGDGAERRVEGQPPYDWAPLAAGKGLGWVTAARSAQGHRDRRPLEPRPLPQVLGAGHRPPGHAHARSGPTATRPTCRTAGCAPPTASSNRSSSTALDPFPTHLQRDAAPLPKGRYTLVRVPIFAGRPRLPRGLADPGHDRGPRRRPPALGLRHDRQGHAPRTRSCSAARRPSKLVLPVLAGRHAPRARRCRAPTALRGEPNRALRRRLQRRLSRHARSGPGMMPR